MVTAFYKSRDLTVSDGNNTKILLSETWELREGIVFVIELEAKMEAKGFALSVDENITSESFIILGSAVLPLFKIWLVIFQNSQDRICFFSTLLRCTWRFLELFASIADSSEYSEAWTTSLLAIDMK